MAGREDFHCGSEEVFTHECVVCKDDENVVRKAEGYCMECKEFLCAKCILHHRSVRISKSHTIKDVDDDIEDIIGQFSGTTIEEDVCQEHSRTRIDMFCRDHNEVGCHLCMTLIHSKCNKEPIASAVLAFDDSKLENEMKELRCVSNGLRQTQDANESVGKQAIKAYDSFIESQRLQRRQILQTIRASQAVDERVGVINSVLAECKQKNKMVEDGTKYADTLLQRYSEIYLSNNAEQKFITWKKLKKQVGLLQNTMEDSVVGNKYMFDYSMVAEGICVYKTVESDASSVSDFYAVLNKDVKLPMGKVIFKPLPGQDTIVQNGVTQTISTKHQCITAMKLYENESMEELRYEWYHEVGVLNKGRIDDIKMDLVTTPEKDPYKLLLLGDWNAGKTTFIRRSISGNISKVYKDSMGVYVHPITLSTSAGEITFDVWDTCGQERFGPLRDGIFEKAKCAIIMFDVSSPTSVNSVRRWYKVINERCGQIPFTVCGNRFEKAKQEIKSSNVGNVWELNIPCISYQLISGKTIENFEAPFLMIARALLSNYSMTVTTKCVLYPPVDFKRTGCTMAGREDFHCGSEEVFSHECVVCKDDENVVRKAEGYCMECKEFLCAKCILHHRSMRISKSHTIKDVDDDIEDIIGQFSGTTIEEDVCQEHSRTRIDMFCRDHNEVGCQVCMTLIHSKCTKEPIASAVLAFDDSKLENEMKELRCVSNGLRQTQDANESVGKQAIKAYNSFIESQRLQRRQILQTIRASQAVDKRVKVGVINSVLAECKQKNKMVEDGTKYANTLLQRSSEIYLSNNAEQKFITWNKLKKQVGLLQNTMKDSVVGNKYMFDNSMVAEGICVYKTNKTVESDACSVSGFYAVMNKDIKMDLVTTPEKDPYKLLLLGDWNAGKTTFIRRSISGNISKVYKDSMGVNVHPITLSTSAGEITFDVWDTCGQERFGPLRDGIFKKAKCAIIMFDVSSPTSVDSVRRWYKIINERCGQIPFMVCGNRVGKAKQEIKSSNVGNIWELNIPLISGKTTIENFEAPFLTIARVLLSNYSMTVTTKCALYPPVDFKRTDTAIKGPSNNHQEDQDDL